MNQTEQMRKLINLLTESSQPQVDPVFAKRLLMKISPTVRDAPMLDEDSGMSAATGTFISFVSIFLGGTEVANIGPLDARGAQEKQREITMDIKDAYAKSHPAGFTDGSGTIYRLSDWDINVETCHSSECDTVLKPRIDALRARAQSRM